MQNYTFYYKIVWLPSVLDSSLPMSSSDSLSPLSSPVWPSLAHDWRAEVAAMAAALRDLPAGAGGGGGAGAAVLLLPPLGLGSYLSSVPICFFLLGLLCFFLSFFFFLLFFDLSRS